MRSHYCGDLRASHDGEAVRLCGWVHRRRDHGGVIFLDLRDRTGLVQVVFDPDTEEAFALADKVRGEYVLQLEGRVRLRDESVRNPRMDTGDIEVLGVRSRHRGSQQGLRSSLECGSERGLPFAPASPSLDPGLTGKA